VAIGLRWTDDGRNAVVRVFHELSDDADIG